MRLSEITIGDTVEDVGFMWWGVAKVTAVLKTHVKVHFIGGLGSRLATQRIADF